MAYEESKHVTQESIVIFKVYFLLTYYTFGNDLIMLNTTKLQKAISFKIL